MARKLKQEFDRDGFVFCQKFSCKELSDILENLRRVLVDVVPGMAGEHVFYENQEIRSSLKQLQLLHEYDSWFGALANTGPFQELAEQLLGEPAVCKNMQFFDKPPKIGKPTPAHQDGFYFKLDPPQALTMWLALEQVDEQNGCVRYIPGSHKEPMRPHGSTGTLGFSQGILDFPNDQDRQQEVVFPAQAGDLLAHHALTIHRADGNRSETRSRKALGLIYYGASAREDSLARQQYQRELEKLLVDRGQTQE